MPSFSSWLESNCSARKSGWLSREAEDGGPSGLNPVGKGSDVNPFGVCPLLARGANALGRDFPRKGPLASKGPLDPKRPKKPKGPTPRGFEATKES